MVFIEAASARYPAFRSEATSAFADMLILKNAIVGTNRVCAIARDRHNESDVTRLDLVSVNESTLTVL